MNHDKTETSKVHNCQEKRLLREVGLVAFCWLNRQGGNDSVSRANDACAEGGEQHTGTTQYNAHHDCELHDDEDDYQIGDPEEVFEQQWWSQEFACKDSDQRSHVRK